MPRKRFNSRRIRKLKLFLLTLGCAGILIGIVLGVQAWGSQNRRLRLVSVIYCLCSAGMLAARQVLVAVEDGRRQRRIESA